MFAKPTVLAPKKASGTFKGLYHERSEKTPSLALMAEVRGYVDPSFAVSGITIKNKIKTGRN